MFRSGFDRTARLEGFEDAVLVRSLDTLGTGGCIRLLLRGVTRSGEGEGCGFAASTLEDNGKPLEDTFCEMLSRRWGPFLFPAAFETFDEWTGPRDAFVGCPSLWEAFLLLGSNACPVVGRRTRLPELGGGEFGAEGERSASPFSDPAEAMSAGGPC